MTYMKDYFWVLISASVSCLIISFFWRFAPTNLGTFELAKSFSVKLLFCIYVMFEMKIKPQHWTKRWNWNRNPKLAVSASQTHGLIAQLVKASEWNPVVLGLNSNQANFLQLLLKRLQWWIPNIYYIYIYMYIYIYI